MARIFFMAFDDAGQLGVVKKLRNLGHKVALAQPRYPEFYELLRQQNPAPELIVCDASKLPSHARQSLNYIRSLKAHKTTPILVYNVRKEDESATREKVPGAQLLFGPDVLEAVEQQLKTSAKPAAGA